MKTISNHISCPICNKEYKILSNHIIFKHQISLEQFSILHPNCPLVSQSYKDIMENCGEDWKNKSEKKNKEKEEEYNTNPKLCVNCNKIISFGQKRNKFCNNSCSVAYNNTHRVHSSESKIKISKSLRKYRNKPRGYLHKNELTSCNIFYHNCIICSKLFIHKKHKDMKMPLCSNKECKYEVHRQSGIHMANKNGNRKTWRQKPFLSKYYGQITLDSSWEVILAQSLEDNDIKWNKPKYIIWFDAKEKSHRYFPDFYLPDYDIYLEPKNLYLMKKDKYKMDYVMSHYKINLYLLTNVKMLSWEAVKKMVHL